MVVTGRVSAWNGTTLVASVDGVPGEIVALRHVASVSVGDTALVEVVGGQAWLIGVVGASSPAAPDPAPDDVDLPADGGGDSETVALRPKWSGSWRAGAWRTDTSDLYQGDWTGRGINTGACWWGQLPTDILRVSLELVRGSAGSGGAQTPTMALLAGTSRSAGYPSILATLTGPGLERGETDTWAIPAAWITQMEAGAAGGIGITSGVSDTPYVSLLASGVGMTLTVESTT